MILIRLKKREFKNYREMLVKLSKYGNSKILSLKQQFVKREQC